MTEPLYFGHTAQYWMELEKRVDSIGQGDKRYIEEIAELRGKLNFIRHRLDEINTLLNINDK